MGDGTQHIAAEPNHDWIARAIVIRNRALWPTNSISKRNEIISASLGMEKSHIALSDI